MKIDIVNGMIILMAGEEIVLQMPVLEFISTLAPLLRRRS